MANWPEFRPSRLLARLVASGADFVVVGGYAAIAHGAARLTKDLDITYATATANLERLGTVLLELEARLRGVLEDVPFVPDAETLRHVELLTLTTVEGSLDLLAKPKGAPPYATLRARAELIEVGGAQVYMASLDDLLSMKRAAGRPRDLVDVAELEAIARLRAR